MLVDRTQKRRRNQQSGVRSLEAESGECFCDCLQAERRVFLWLSSTLHTCVKLKTVTKIRRSSARDTSRECLSCTEFFAGLEASGGIKTEVWFFLLFFGMRLSMQRRLWSKPARKERIAVVKAWQNEWGGQFNCSLLDRTNSTELVVAGFGGLIDDSVLSRRTPRLLTVSDRGTVVSSSWRVLTAIEDSFCLVPMSIASFFFTI